MISVYFLYCGATRFAIRSCFAPKNYPVELSRIRVGNLFDLDFWSSARKWKSNRVWIAKHNILHLSLAGLLNWEHSSGSRYLEQTNRKPRAGRPNWGIRE